MNTFHITPASRLAKAAVDQVRAYAVENPRMLIAVRGQYSYGDELDAELYSVSPCPNQRDVGGYEWTYVEAGKWVERYDLYWQYMVD